MKLSSCKSGTGRYEVCQNSHIPPQFSGLESLNQYMVFHFPVAMHEIRKESDTIKKKVRKRQEKKTFQEQDKCKFTLMVERDSVRDFV